MARTANAEQSSSREKQTAIAAFDVTEAAGGAGESAPSASARGQKTHTTGYAEIAGFLAELFLIFSKVLLKKMR